MEETRSCPPSVYLEDGEMSELRKIEPLTLENFYGGVATEIAEIKDGNLWVFAPLGYVYIPKLIDWLSAATEHYPEKK